MQLELRTLRRNVPELEASCTTVRGEAAGYARQVSIWAARAVVAAAGMCVAVVAAAGMCVAVVAAAGMAAAGMCVAVVAAAGMAAAGICVAVVAAAGMAAAGMCVAVVAAAGMCVAFLTRGPYACALVRVCVCGRVRMHVSKSVCVYVFMCASCLCSSVCLCA